MLKLKLQFLGVNTRGAFQHTADIFLRAAARPFNPGDAVCGFTMEPLKLTYSPGEPIVFTSTQVVGGGTSCTGNPIARYEWTFTDGTFEDEGIGRTVTFSGPTAGNYTVEVTTTESGTGCQEMCSGMVVIQ